MAWFNPNQNLFPNTTNGLYCLNLMKNFWVPKPNQAAKKYNEKETKQWMKTTWWESLQRSHKPLSAGWQTCDLLYHQWCSMVAFKRLLLAIQYCGGWLSRLGPQSWNIITSSCSIHPSGLFSALVPILPTTQYFSVECLMPASVDE